MALVKICPTCGEKNDSSEMMCCRCLGDISGINPRQEFEGQDICGEQSGIGKTYVGKTANAPEVSIEPGGQPTGKGGRGIILHMASGESITVNHGDVVGRKAKGENILARFSTVSRRHVRFTFENRRWYVEDLRSTNETYVDDMRMLPGEKVEVKNNVKISLSSSCPLVIEVPSE